MDDSSNLYVGIIVQTVEKKTAAPPARPRKVKSARQLRVSRVTPISSSLSADTTPEQP